MRILGFCHGSRCKAETSKVRDAGCAERGAVQPGIGTDEVDGGGGGGQDVGEMGLGLSPEGRGLRPAITVTRGAQGVTRAGARAARGAAPAGQDCAPTRAAEVRQDRWSQHRRCGGSRSSSRGRARRRTVSGLSGGPRRSWTSFPPANSPSGSARARCALCPGSAPRPPRSSCRRPAASSPRTWPVCSRTPFRRPRRACGRTCAATATPTRTGPTAAARHGRWPRRPAIWGTAGSR